MTSFMPSPKDRKSQANLSQLVHCQECISGPVSWSHSKRWYWFSLEAWPLRCRCPTDLVSCPLCEALAICLICGRSDGCERNLQLNFQICVCVIWQHGERKEKKKISKMFRCGRNKDLHASSFIQLFWPKNGLWKQSQTISQVHFSERYPCAPFFHLLENIPKMSALWQYSSQKAERALEEDHARQFF